MNKLCKGPRGDATYKISKLCTFQFQRRRILKFAVFVSMFQHVLPERGSVLTLGHHMNKLGRGPLGDATHQISKLKVFHFQRRKILKFVFFVPMLQLVTPRAEQVLTLGASYI